MRKLLVFVFAFVSLYSNSQTMCGGGSYTLQAPIPATLTGMNHTLMPGGFSSTGGTFVVSPPATTTYTLRTTGLDPVTNTTKTESIVTTLTVFPQPSSIPSITQAVCSSSYNAVNLGLSFNPATPVPGYTVNWDPLPGSVVAPNQYSATNLQAGPFTVQVVAAGGCSTSVQFTILPQPAPAVFTVTPFGSTHSITCVTSTVELVASNPNLSYTWTGSSFNPVQSATMTLDATKLGTLGVIGQSTSGCVASYTFLLIQNISVPTVSLSHTSINITCSQTLAPTLSITASPSVNVVNHVYAPGGSIFTAASFTTIFNVGITGIHTVVAEDISNGCKSEKTFTVTSSDAYPTFDVKSATNFSMGCGITATANITIENAQSVFAPGAPLSFTIIGPGTSTAIISPPGNLSGVLVYYQTLPGSYTVITRDNGNGCDSRTQVSILQNTFTPQIAVEVPKQILTCAEPTMTLTGSSTTTPVQYNWSFIATPGNQAGPLYTVNIIPPSGGPTTPTLINTYTLTVTDMNNKCISQTVVPVYQNTFKPTTVISSQSSPSLTCNTPTVILSHQSKTSIPPATIFSTVQPVVARVWDGPSPQEPLQGSSTYTAGTTGVYTLTTLDGNNGCISTGTFHVGDNKVFPTVLPKDTIIDCGQPFIILRPSIAPTSSLTYSWSGQFTVGVNSLPIFTVTNPGIYTVAVTNTINGCKITSVTVVGVGSLTAGFAPDVEQGYAPLTVTFSNTSTSSTGASSVMSSWSFGNGTTTGSMTTGSTPTFTPGPISGSLSPVTVYSLPGTYKVTMYARKGACLDTAVKYIKVDIPSALEIPNVFTPNGDGINDLFFLKSNNLSEINMTIVDRWGHIVYDLKSTTGNVEWDGKNGQGTDAADGTYYYVLKAVGKDGATYDKKGTISLIR